MLLPCHQVKALYPAEKLLLDNDGPTTLLWDRHDGPFILRVDGLKTQTEFASDEPPGIVLDLSLPPTSVLIPDIQTCAAHHNLTLPTTAAAPLGTLQPVILAAFHVPGRNLFVFSEDSKLRLTSGPSRTVQLQIQGSFRATRLPCQKADLIIHLAPDIAALVLSYLWVWGRSES
ncbi:MAG: hypothetical protein PHW74_01235 [Desulfobacca sp.]|nr:hypothetical protein [Desulfobacca sp.]